MGRLTISISEQRSVEGEGRFGRLRRMLLDRRSARVRSRALDIALATAFTFAVALDWSLLVRR